MDFLWTKIPKPHSYPTLDGDKSTQVLVIGGGMAGVLCARQLREQGVSTILVEARQLGGGITKGTTAVLTAQHDTLYQQLIKSFGADKAKQYLQANLQAVEQFRRLAREIPSDLENMPSLMYSLNDRQLMEREAAALNSLGFAAEFVTDTPMPFPVAGAVRYPGMAQFHPLKFLHGAAEGLTIYENTFVEKLEGTTAITSHGTIHAKQVIVATHYPFVNSHGLYFMKLYQQRSYVIALENAPELGCTIVDAAENGIYLRNYNGLLLVGGGDHRTGKQEGGFAVPRDFAAKHFPKAREVMSWANQDCISLDGVPYIGKYGGGQSEVYVAAGFNLWGMTGSMVASDLLCKQVTGRKSQFADVFTPQRSILRGQLFANMGETVLDFVKPTTKRCSHLGCALQWNPAEHSWDCPCHGSRFDKHGKLIDNPAMRDSHVE